MGSGALQRRKSPGALQGDSLLVIGDPISERDHIDAILQGTLEECNPFIMMIYSKVEHAYIYDVEAFLYIQEAQLDNYRQELTSFNATTNVVKGLVNSEGTKHVAYNANGHQYYCGRGRNTRGRVCGRKTYTTSNMPTCQLCNKYGHYVLECWHRFDESFHHAHNQP
ncbi:hypothetical protein KIW84_031052 [Lathyrus oleraceus]|uniref:Uncharacterized protein n=1 Tax=Pisum sativum TaxID=3888 RepID=A0A9D4XQX8_PEA|nr:hypothetical protein KIW84_031052 [Pisum sativum]